MKLFRQVYGTNKAAVEGFGGSTPNLGDSSPSHVPVNGHGGLSGTGPRKSKSGIVFGHSNNISYNEGTKDYLYFHRVHIHMGVYD